MNNNINFKELRLDNYICINNNLHPCRVKEITMSSVIVESIKENYSEPTINSMNPIPLTEEWLLKFGFERHHFDYSNGVIYIKDVPNNNEFKWGVYPFELGSGFIINKSKNLKYVHQLQNLYFALTNEELTMK
jgi:hypothetical protein